jgi:integrase
MAGKLTLQKIDVLKARAKPFKVSDAGGLFVLVMPNGSKLWRVAYRFPRGPQAKQRTLTLGAYDREANGLVEARHGLAAAKRALKEGRDPGRVTLNADGAETFEAVARSWHRKHEEDWAPKYAAQIMTRLEQDVFPEIGGMTLGTVKRSHILDALAKVEGRGAVETAHRLKAYIGEVFRHSDDDSISDPTPMLRGRLKKRPAVQHHKALKARELGPFLLKLDATPCDPETRLAILLTILTAARTAEIIGARWEEFEDLKYPAKALWRIPGERMKKNREHLIPLNREALSVLAALHDRTGHGVFVFPSNSRSGHMSNNTMLYHLYDCGYRNKSTIHGFRGSFSTIANESGLWEEDWIEMQLAHADDDKVRAAYNSALYLPKRRELMTWWGDQVEGFRERERMDVRIMG